MAPRLDVQITKDAYERAAQSDSGGCLIADAIKEQFPFLSHVRVDMATIRATDRKKGERYTWLTPADAQYTLLFYDQGWPHVREKITIVRPIKVNKVTTNPKKNATRAERLAILEAKIAAGEELNSAEKAQRTMLLKPPRPTSQGKTQVKGRGGKDLVVHGGKAIPTDTHPNLLAGRDRHFGAQLADPGEVFNEAVDMAVARKISEMADVQPES
jgi:hypothetical protein